jgi:hypothetical protein
VTACIESSWWTRSHYAGAHGDLWPNAQRQTYGLVAAPFAARSLHDLLLPNLDLGFSLVAAREATDYTAADPSSSAEVDLCLPMAGGGLAATCLTPNRLKTLADVAKRSGIRRWSDDPRQRIPR